MFKKAVFSPAYPARAKTRAFPVAAAASEGPRHTFFGMLRFRARREQSWRPFSTACLVPGHVVLIEQILDRFDAVAQETLGLLGHRHHRADRPSRFHLLQRRERLEDRFFVF